MMSFPELSQITVESEGTIMISDLIQIKGSHKYKQGHPLPFFISQAMLLLQSSSTNILISLCLICP